MGSLLDKLEQGRRFLNRNYERFVSKTLARLLLGHEVDGYDYKAPTPVELEREEGYNKQQVKNGKRKSKDIETSLTLDYRKNAWGIEGVVRDTVSNHLPADSKGTSIAVEYLQDGRWIDFRDADREKHVEAIRVKDDGKGFDYNLLSVLYSTKTDDNESIGQFGEGMKLVATACLRNGIDIEYRSRDWSAKPYAIDEFIDGNILQRLCFAVEEEQSKIDCSETIFHNPRYELVEEFNRLSDNVLYFNREYEILFTFKSWLGYKQKIFDLKNGKTGLFVKGVRIKKGLDSFGDSKFNSIFSYDLEVEDISPDRKSADEWSVRERINHLLRGCENDDVHRTILEIAHRAPDEYFEEYYALDNTNIIGSINLGGEIRFSESNKMKNRCSGDEIWRKMFHEVFGEKAVLESGEIDADKDAQALGYTVIKLNPLMNNYLQGIGVKSASDLLKSEREYKWVDISDLTDDERSMLDRIPRIHKVVLGCDLETNVRVYEGQYLITRSAEGHNLRVGEELETDCGFYTKKDPQNPGKDLIGIKRGVLSSRHDFMKTYIHELGHKVTGKGDYDREFTHFFVDALAMLSAIFVELSAKSNKEIEQ